MVLQYLYVVIEVVNKNADYLSSIAIAIIVYLITQEIIRIVAPSQRIKISLMVSFIALFPALLISSKYLTTPDILLLLLVVLGMLYVVEAFVGMSLTALSFVFYSFLSQNPYLSTSLYGIAFILLYKIYLRKVLETSHITKSKIKKAYNLVVFSTINSFLFSLSFFLEPTNLMLVPYALAFGVLCTFLVYADQIMLSFLHKYVREKAIKSEILDIDRKILHLQQLKEEYEKKMQSNPYLIDAIKPSLNKVEAEIMKLKERKKALINEINKSSA